MRHARRTRMPAPWQSRKTLSAACAGIARAGQYLYSCSFGSPTTESVPGYVASSGHSRSRLIPYWNSFFGRACWRRAERHILPYGHVLAKVQVPRTVAPAHDRPAPGLGRSGSACASTSRWRSGGGAPGQIGEVGATTTARHGISNRSPRQLGHLGRPPHLHRLCHAPRRHAVLLPGCGSTAEIRVTGLSTHGARNDAWDAERRSGVPASRVSTLTLPLLTALLYKLPCLIDVAAPYPTYSSGRIACL